MAVNTDLIGGAWFVYGIPGTGKTLLGGIADGLIPAVKRGRRVYTNITGLSVAGISAVAEVPPLSVDIRLVESVSDILTAFDSPDSVGSLFILDEMRQVLDVDGKSENWLSQRLNIMRKRGIDFILIAQVPGYFSADLRGLARGCSEFRRMYGFGLGFKNKTREYRFNSGTPRIVSGRREADGLRVRTLDPLLYTCYDSYIDGQIKGNEDGGRAISFWRSPKAIIGYCFVFAILLLLCFAVFMFFHIKDSVTSFGSAISSRPPVPVDSTKKAVQNEHLQDSSDSSFSCYNYIICDSEYCKTDLGFFPVGTYKPDFGGIVTPRGVLSLCGGD